MRRRSRLIEMQKSHAPQVAQFIFRMLLAIDDPFGQEFLGRVRRICSGDERAHRSSKWIVLSAERVTATVPDADRFAGCVVERPAFAGLHAGLVDAVAEQVVRMTHDDAVPGVDDFPLIPLDVEKYARAVELFLRRSRGPITALELVVSDGEKSASERIEVRYRRRFRVDGSLLGGGSLGVSDRRLRPT